MTKNQHSGGSIRRITLPLILTSLIASSLWAQEDDQVVDLSPYEVNSSRDRGYYANNSLSATKTAVPINNIPINIQVMTRDFIDDVQAYDIDDAAQYVAGAAPSTNEPGRFAIRGFTSPNPIRNGVTTLEEFHFGTTTIERMEIVKGPSAILYGITEPGGIINYVTKKPLPDFAASLRQVVGSFDKYRTEIDVTGPATSGFDYRLAASYENSGSHIKGAGIEETIVAPSVLWNIGENTKWLIALEYHNIKRALEGNRVQNAAQTDYYDLPRSFNGDGPLSYKDNQTVFFNSDFQHTFFEHWTFRQVLNIAENNYIQDTRVGYATAGAGPADDNEVRFHLLFRDVPRNEITTQTELSGRFEFGSNNLNVLIGHEYKDFEQRQIARRQNNVMIWDLDDPSTWDTSFPVAVEDRALTPADFLRSTDQQTIYSMVQAGFADDRLRILLGARYDILNGDNINYLAGGVRDVNPEIKNTTPQAGFLFRINDPLAVYALYSESFTPNLQVNPDGSTFDPATGEGLEFGLKFDLMENRLSGTLSFYEIEKNNIVRIDQDAQQADPPVLQYRPSGTEKSRGMDLDFVYSPNDNYQAVFSYAYIGDAYVVANEEAPQEEGNRLAYAPKNSVSFWNKYTFREGPLNGVFLGAGIVHQDPMHHNTSASVLLTPAYTRLDLLVGYSGHLGERPFRVDLKIDNVTDELYNARQHIVAPGINFLASFRIQY